MMFYPEIQATANEIARLGKPLKIYLISHKTNHATSELLSFKLALIVSIGSAMSILVQLSMIRQQTCHF